MDFLKKGQLTGLFIRGESCSEQGQLAGEGEGENPKLWLEPQLCHASGPSFPAAK